MFVVNFALTQSEFFRIHCCNTCMVILHARVLTDMTVPSIVMPCKAQAHMHCHATISSENVLSNQNQKTLFKRIRKWKFLLSCFWETNTHIRAVYVSNHTVSKCLMTDFCANLRL